MLIVLIIFIPGDTVRCIYADINNLFAGGIINQYGLPPDSIKQTSHLVRINPVNGKLLRAFSNTLSTDYFRNVSKIDFENNKLYFIAERYNPVNLHTVMERSLISFDALVPNGIAEYLLEAYAPLQGIIPTIDDFIKKGNDFYIIGDFSQLAYGTGSITNINQTACYNLISKSFKVWNHLAPYNLNSSNLRAAYGVKEHQIVSFQDWIFFSLPYSITIHAKENADLNSNQKFNEITGLPVLASLTPISGIFSNLLKICSGKLIVINREISTLGGPNAFPNGYNQRNFIYSYCLKTRDAVAPKEINNLNTFCKYKSYQFYEPLRPDYIYCKWSYSGTGATIINNGNDTVTITFALNASSGNLIVEGVNNCGQTGYSGFTAINFYPLPDIFAGNDTTLNCKNKKQIIIKGSTNLSNYSLKWNGPKTINAPPNTSIDTAGIYYLKIINNLNSCVNFDTMLVKFDTIKPIFTCPISYSITTCNPNYISVNAISNNTSDSVKWFGPGIPESNPALIYNANNYIIEAKNNSNGCKATAIVTVKSTIVPPKINIP